jgi:antirestriction protein ArdC
MAMARRFIVGVIAVVAYHPVSAGADSLTPTELQARLDLVDPSDERLRHCEETVERNEDAERVSDNYLKNGPTVEHHPDRVPYYSLLFDMVVLPDLRHSCTAAMYYHRLYHELGHSTAATHRLDRALSRADEEVVAELTAILLLRRVDIDVDYSHARSIFETYRVSRADLERLWLEALRATVYIASGEDRPRATPRIPASSAY